MVAEVNTQRPPTPNLIPVPPEWLRRQEDQAPANANRNINDIYWQKPDGWIVVDASAEPGADGRPLTRQAETLLRRGWKPLLEYSFTNRVSPKTGRRETIETNADRLNTPDRYYWLFYNQGAKLFTIEQIVEHHWHITPPYGLPKAVFPQLEEWDVPEPYWCPACAGVRPPKNSTEQVAVHLTVEHRMTLVQVRDLQQQTNDFRDKPAAVSGVTIRRRTTTAGVAPPPPEKSVYVPGAPMTPPAGIEARLPICNSCGEQIEGPLADHNCALLPGTLASVDDLSTLPEAGVAPEVPTTAAAAAKPPAAKAAPRKPSPRPRRKAP